jgi:hypothetical protein
MSSAAVATALAEISSVGSDGVETLQTLQRLLMNIVADPSEPKFRRVRKSNPTISRLVVGVPGAIDVLRAAGFVEEGAEHLVLPQGNPLDPTEEVAALVTEALAALQDSLAAEARAKRQAELTASAKKRDDDKRERERIAALAKAEQAERRAAEAERGGPCSSRAVDRAFGAKAATYKDIGIDLNNQKGG